MFAPGAGRWLGGALAAILLGAVLALRVAPLAPIEAGLAAAAALWAFFAWFLRDPERPVGPGIVAPADGRVRAVEERGGRWTVSIFMNVTDVHVNRFPVGGRVVAIEEAGEGHRPAFLDDAFHNQRRRYLIESRAGAVEVVQRTGIVARRLVSFVQVGSPAVKGARFGMIVLGSRVDVSWPADAATPIVSVGDRLKAGASSIAGEPR